MNYFTCNPAELAQKLEERKEGTTDFFLLDVRSPGEHAQAKIEGTDKLIPVTELAARMNELEDWKTAGKDIIVYCHSGGRSALACELLKRAGFESLHNLHGGIMSFGI